MLHFSVSELLIVLAEKNIIKKDNSINSNCDKLLDANIILKTDLLYNTEFLNLPTLKNSMRIKILQQGISTLPICANQKCREPVIISNRRISTHCSSKCARSNPDTIKKYKETCKVRYGDENPNATNIIKERISNTCQEKYGVNSPLESKIIQDKIKKTNKKKYNHECPLSSLIIREKIIQTNLIKYGKECPLANKKIHDKTKESLNNNHRVDYPLQSPIIMNTKKDSCNKKYGVNHWSESQINTTSYKKLNDAQWLYNQHIVLKKPFIQIGDELNVYYGTVANYLHKHGYDTNYSQTSIPEAEIHDLLNSKSIEFIKNTRKIISPYELDIFIPDHNIAIEFNGNYWHSELAGKDKKYHMNKTTLCNAANIQLLHIFESEWLYKQNIVKSRILNILHKNKRIFARKCEIVLLSNTVKNTFLINNHIQGNIGSPINYGLIYDNKVVAVMCFGKSRFSKHNEYELLRYTSLTNTSVVGGASKLFNHFIKSMNPASIVSYCDLRYGIGKLYTILGFTFTHTSSPNYYYFHRSNTMQLYSRNKFQKHKLKKLLDLFDPKLTEWENMQNNGYNRIWDCGNSVWQWNKS